MSFHNQFMSSYTSEEQKTDLLKLWSTIGCNTEKTIMEEISAQNYESADINNFTSETYKSWLGFFMRKIPNKVAPRCKITVTVSGTDSTVFIPRGSVLNSRNGQYVQLKDVTLSNNSPATFTAVQGRLVTQTVDNYNKNYAVIPANNIDLSTLVVKNGRNQIIPEVEYSKSFASMHYKGSCYVDDNGIVIDDSGENNVYLNDDGSLGDFYNVHGDIKMVSTESLGKLNGLRLKTGDIIIHDGKNWTYGSELANLLPYQLEYEFAIPRNGYYAFYSDGNLYIKIFAGKDVPDTSRLQISYIATDGIQGEVESGSAMSYVSDITDTLGKRVSVEIQNEKSSNGINEVSRGQLNMLLRQTMLSGTTISSIPEYSAWFNSQPEIGNACVYSDFEEYIRTGKMPVSTGLIYVLALDRNGEDLYNNKSIQNELLKRIDAYKDIGLISFQKCNKVEVCFDVRFYSTTSDNEFAQLVQSEITRYFDIDFLRGKNLTLFDDLDISQFIRDIGTSYSVNGLDINCYHYQNKKLDTPMNGISFEIPTTEFSSGAHYYFTPQDETEVVEFWEKDVIGVDVATIYVYDKKGQPVEVGFRDNSLVTIHNYKFTKGLLEIKIPIKNSAILTLSDRKSYRVLANDANGYVKPIDVRRYDKLTEVI